MKCIRDVGWDETYSQFRKGCRIYHKKHWKKTTPYYCRSRLCTKALKQIWRKNRKLYHIESAYTIYTFDILFDFKKKRWQ